MALTPAAVETGHQPALTAIAVATCLMTAVSFSTAGNISSGVREDRSNRWVLIALVVIGLLAAYLPASLTGKRCGPSMETPSAGWALVLFIAGGTLRMWAVFVLGRRFSGLVAIQSGPLAALSTVYAI
jgi:hypothetical protein